MGMKGRTIIELTNTETGEKRTYEDNNMVTNFLEQFCIPTGPVNYNLYAMLASYARQKDATTKTGAALNIEQPHCFTQGLLLFEDEIDEDADNIWPRVGNKMIGQAGNSSYSGSNAKAGSYNSIESGPVENGYRYVWDFTSSQANGQISCACLTTPWGGISGAGNDEVYSDYITNINQFVSYFSQHEPSFQEQWATDGIPLLIDYDKKCSYQLKGICTSKCYPTPSSSALENHSCFLKKEIRIRREKIPFDEFSIFSKVAKTVHAIDFEDLVFPMPQEIIDSCAYDAIFTKANLSASNFNLNTTINSWGKHIYIYFAFANISTSNKNSERMINAGDDLIIIDIDTEAETCKTFKVRNTTGSYIRTSITYDYWANCKPLGPEDDPGYYNTFIDRYQPIFVTDKYVIMHTEDGKIYRISRVDNTDVKAFTLEGDEENAFIFGAPYKNPSYRIYFSPLGKNVEQFNKNKVIGYRGADNRTFMLDFENATVSLLLTKDSSFYSSSRIVIKILGTDLFALCANNSDACTLYGGTFPNFLTTINNLDAPVLKTAADIMKVTYIITNGDV